MSLKIRVVTMVAGLLVASGCSGDFGEVGPMGDATEGLDGGTAPTTGQNPESADSTDGAAEPTDSDGANDDSGGDTDDFDCPIDCGDGGTCDWSAEGTPYCACFDGFVAYGLRCLECTPTSGLADIDIPVVAVTATFTLNGEGFPTSTYEHGLIVLRDPATGDEIELGSTRTGGTVEAVPVLPGPYEVHYSHRTGGTVVPANEDARVDTVNIPDVDAYEFAVDVPGTEISGDIRLGNAEPPSSVYENGTVLLRNRSTGDEITLADTRDKEFRAVVVPGTYDIHYRRVQAETTAPINEDAVIGELDVLEGVGAQPIDINVPVTTLSGSFRLDGRAPPNSVYENGWVVLRNLQTGDEVTLGETREGTYASPVVPGDYAMVYRRVLGGDVVPVNSRAVLGEITLEAGAQLLDIDIQTAVITGTITIDGAPAPADPSNDGVLLLRNALTGDEAILGNTHDGSYARRVVRGAYDVHYRQETSSGLVPVNTNARIDAIDVQGGASFDIDVPIVAFGADITLNGMLPPDSAYDDGMLYLRNAETGDSVLLGSTRMASLARPVVPGTYDLVYVVEAAGPTVPVNAAAQLATIDVDTVTQIDVDIPVTAIGGAILVAGETPPISVYNRGDLFLHDVGTEDSIYLGPVSAGSFGQSVTAGVYVLAYHGHATTGTLPANSNTGLACYALTTP